MIFQNNKAFTLIELLVVITILGFLVAMAIPAGNFVDNKARKKMTLEQFTALRTGILGIQNSYDTYGNKTFGGYVGMTGFLPKLYLRSWNDTDEKWEYDTTTSTPTGEYISTINTTRNSFPQPVGLWDDNFGKLTPGWERSVLSTPIDPLPDNQVWDYAEPSEQRLFLLREGGGGFTDGWGQTLLIYSNDFLPDGKTPKDLTFVSVGPDGDYDPSDPLDPTLPNNSDNLFIHITEDDWDYTHQKEEQTHLLLNTIKAVIAGTDKNIILNTVSIPHGFIADIGSPDFLTASYIRDGSSNRIYRCTTTHVSSSFSTTSGHWDLAWDNADTAKNFPEWKSTTNYVSSNPHLIQVNSDIVWNKGNTYRCIQDNSGVEPGVAGSWQNSWKIDLESDIIDTLYYLWNTVTNYKKNPIPTIQRDATSQLTAGWRGTYMPGIYRFPLSDAWKTPIEIQLAGDRSIVFISAGSDRTLGTSDDIMQTIDRKTYECALEVTVTHAINSLDTLFVSYPEMGRIVSRKLNPVGSGSSELFVFHDTTHTDKRLFPNGRISIHYDPTGATDISLFNTIISPTVTNTYSLP